MRSPAKSALVASTDLETWKDWLAFHVIEDYAGALPKAFGDERFAFFGKALSGTPAAASTLEARRRRSEWLSGRRRRTVSTRSDTSRPRPRRKPRPW